MVYVSRWKSIAIILVCVLGILYSVPNALNSQTRDWIDNNLPSWMPHKTVNLGLDLQGGSHLLLEVDVNSVIKERSEAMIDGARTDLRKESIGYTRISTLPEGGARIQLRDPDADYDKVKKILREQENGLDISLENNTVKALFGDTLLKEIRDQTIEHSIETVRRRVDETGTREPVIQRQGEDRILIQLPGLDDPSRVKALLGKTAKLTFHMVADAGEDARSTVTYPFMKEPERKLALDKRALLTGDLLISAQYCSTQYGKHAVCFRFNNRGAKRFCDITRENVNKPFAIVLDGEIVTAPNINEPICGGSGQISGGFDTATEASDIALLLRAGALPAPLEVVEERTVGPSLGEDSVEAGKEASLIGMALVIFFMAFTYGRFGLMADAALLVNVALIFACLSGLQATLTLPGIAGIVLTIGMAVDANVLIFERIREEIRAGRSPLSAVDAGYRNVQSTIFDANLTTLIAAFILFSFGTGPVKGFAVTLAIGIVTSLFSALMVTRLILALWISKSKTKELKF